MLVAWSLVALDCYGAVHSFARMSSSCCKSNFVLRGELRHAP